MIVMGKKVYPTTVAVTSTLVDFLASIHTSPSGIQRRCSGSSSVVVIHLPSSLVPQVCIQNGILSSVKID